MGVEWSFRLMSEKYANGKANATEYNEARTNWMKAVSDMLQAKYDVAIDYSQKDTLWMH